MAVYHIKINLDSVGPNHGRIPPYDVVARSNSADHIPVSALQ